jgi:uncharacterized protein (DUF58 family)
MSYASRIGLLTKLDFARSLLAALALIARRQRDACGIALLAEELTGYLAPSPSPGRTRAVWATLESTALSRQTALARILSHAADVAPKSCLFVIASDFYEDPQEVGTLLHRLRYEGHDVLGLQVADPQEEDFNFTDPSQFEDPETGAQLPIDPPVAAAAYRAAFAAHRAKLHEVFLANNFAHLSLRTDAPPLAALGAYLARRAGKA